MSKAARNYPGVSKWDKISRGVGYSVYGSILSFAMGEESTRALKTSDTPSETHVEMVALAGFSIYCLLILTAFTASSAAAMVLIPYSGPMYHGDELAQIFLDNETICIADPVRENFLSIYRNDILHLENVVGLNMEDIVDEYYNENSKCTTIILNEDEGKLI